MRKVLNPLAWSDSWRQASRLGLRVAWLVLFGLTALAATPMRHAEDLVRQGNAAFDQGDFAAALESYGQAEERTLDPGLVAFNEATALYQLGRYRDAELHYRRALEEAAVDRRARLWYNLGNSLLQQGRGANRIREAIAFYEKCLQDDAIEAELAADTRHNLELARLLLQKAASSRESQNESSPEQGGGPQPDDPHNDIRAGADQPANTQPDARAQPGAAATQQGNRNTTPTKTDQPPPPGKGTLPPIPDEEELAAMSPEDAAEHLKQAATRIQRERREYRQRTMPPPPANVLDW